MSKRKTRKSVKRPVKQPANIFNIYHPDVADKIEPAFKVKGIQYYNFKKDAEVRAGRYIIIANMLQEVYWRMDRELLRTYAKRIRSEIDGTKGQINIGNAIAFVDQ